MRNLCVNSKISHEFQEGEVSKFVLSDDGPITYKSGKLWLHSISEAETTEIIDLQQTFEQEGTKLENETCSDISYFSDGRIIISFDSGLLISIDINLKSIEVIGSFPTGLSGIWKSQDDELLVLTAKDNAVILMTAGDYEPLLEFNPDQETNEAFANVNVGWGAKATQFHGKAGKSAREVTQEAPEEASESDLKVVWRDDGLYFAVSYVGNDKIRRIRVFNRQGQLQSTSEDVKSLGTSLAWKPNGGALIASSMKLPNGKDVIGFFEKNGLRHGEFLLQNPCKVHDLKWNCDASILALHLTTEINEDLIQLWTVSNYKWQLKKTFGAKKFLGFIWDTVSAMTLFTFETDKCTQIEMKFKIHKSSGHLSYMAVIDGRTCKVTPFAEMVVPPPISAFELHFPVNIEDLVFVQDFLTVITEDSIYNFIPGASPNDDLVKITGAGGSGFVPKCTTLGLNEKCQFVNAGLYNWNVHMEYLIAYNQATITILSKVGDNKQEIICEDTIHDIIPYAAGFHVILVDGTLLTLNDDLQLEVESWCLKPKCTQIEAYGSDLIVSLNERNQRLYLNDREIATGVTSFFIHSDFLMVTTVKHTLKSLPLEQLVHCQNDNIWSQESVRALERGSKLVISVSNDTKTILQMPRGNLEVIHPRALAIHILKQFLDTCQYSKAMEMLRKQRINLNLLVDHNPQLFMENINAFLEQVPNMDRLCVFIADLANENVTKTMYASSYQTASTENPKKVDEICQLLLQTMEQQDKEKFILPIISCHVKSSKSSLDSALLQIQNLPPKLKEEALNFLLLLVNVNQLFDVALGLYDFDLVLYVAERSQKDPKEYFPFLNELKKYEENYRKYKINLHLKRYEKALECLAKNEDYLDEALDLVKNQRLYNQALKLYQIESKSYVEMCRIYGDYLVSKKYYEDAALIYEAANLNLEAISAWEQSENWNFCLSLAQEHIRIPAEMTNLCLRLVEKLKDSHRHAEAANILLEYLNNPEEALVVLLQGQVWNKAIWLIYKHNRMDLYETNLKPALVEASNELIGQLDKKLSNFQGYVNRFQEVVKMKEKLADGNYEETDINIEDADMYSDVTSLKSGISKVKSKPGSIKTRVSKKSSRSRRKDEMKKYSTKEGSKYEDLGLMAAIHDLMTLTYKTMYSEVAQILRALVKFKFFEQAQTIQAKMEQLDDEFKVSEHLVWNPKWNENNEDSLKFGPEATTEDIINRASSGYKPEFNILEAKFRFAPVKPANCNDWKLQILMK